MAELAKKLYLKNTSGTTQTVKLYSTVAEANAAGGGVLNLKVDDINCYAALGATNNTYATSGRVSTGGGDASHTLPRRRSQRQCYASYELSQSN